MDFDTSEYIGEFLHDMTELLEELDESLLIMEENPEDRDVINKIFRVAHSLKGMAGIMGFKKMENLTHSMEDVLYEVRSNKIVVTKGIINVLLVCNDILVKLMESISDTGSEDVEIENTELLEKNLDTAHKALITNFRLILKDKTKILMGMEDVTNS